MAAVQRRRALRRRRAKPNAFRTNAAVLVVAGVIRIDLTQFFTGHGYLNGYLARMHKVKSLACSYHDFAQDDTCHTFYECAGWKEDKEE